MIPRVCLLDRDGCLNVASSDASSPLYYLLDVHRLILKPSVREAAAIIKAHGIPVILATKQRCISKGLTSREQVDIINLRLQRLLELPFDHILIESELDNKAALYTNALKMYPDINPQHFALFDDSPDERMIANRLGITTYDGADLYRTVCKAFNVR